MKQQHRASYSPQLFPANTVYVMRKNIQGVPFFEVQGTESETQPTYAMHITPFQLRNVGLGSAHSIEIGWQYDHTAITKELVHLGQQTGLIFREADDHFSFQFGNDPEARFGFAIKHPKEHIRKIAALIPGEKVDLSFPKSILNYLAFRAVTELIALDINRHEISDHGCKLLLKYKDIGGTSLKQQISVHIYLLTYTLPDATPGSDHALCEVHFFVPHKRSRNRAD